MVPNSPIGTEGTNSTKCMFQYRAEQVSMPQAKSDRLFGSRKQTEIFFAGLPSTQLIMVQCQNFNNNITRYALQLVRDFEIHKYVLIDF